MQPRPFLPNHGQLHPPDQVRPHRLGFMQRRVGLHPGGRVRPQQDDAAIHRGHRRDDGAGGKRDHPQQHEYNPDRSGGDGQLRGQRNLAAALDRFGQRLAARFELRDLIAEIVVVHGPTVARISRKYCAFRTTISTNAGRPTIRTTRHLHSGCRPMSWTTLLQRSYWACTKAPVASGVSAPSVKKPTSASLFTISGVLRILSISRFNRVMTSAGVPAGAAITNQPVSSTPG